MAVGGGALADGASTVTLTYDQSMARIPAVLRLMGYPQRNLANVARSVRNVAAHFGDRRPRP